MSIYLLVFMYNEFEMFYYNFLSSRFH